MSENIRKDSDGEYWDNFYAQLASQPIPEPEVLPWRIMIVERFIIWAFDYIYSHLPRWMIYKIVKKGKKLSRKRFNVNQTLIVFGGQAAWDNPECAEKGYSVAYEQQKWIEMERILGKRINPVSYDDEMHYVSEACSRAYYYAKERFIDSPALFDFAYFCFIAYEKVLRMVLWVKGYKEKTIPMININL